MQNEIYSQELRTICNAVIQIGDIDDTGKGRHFVSKFIQDGLVKIEGHGIVLLKKETIDQSLQSMVGAPVIIKHQDVTNENADELRCGVISKAYFNDFDGWYYCEGIIWDEKAKELVNNGWSVSCSYDFLAYNDEGGVENNIKYDKEFTQLNFTHLAIVDNPRYERANIVFNSKDNNGEGKWITVHPNGEDSKGTHIFIRKGETLEDAMKRNGWGNKQADKSDKPDTKSKQSDTKKETNTTKDTRKHIDRIEKLIKKYNLEPHKEDELLDELGSFEAKLDEGLEPREEEELREKLFDFEDDIKLHQEMKKQESKQSDAKKSSKTKVEPSKSKGKTKVDTYTGPYLNKGTYKVKILDKESMDRLWEAPRINDIETDEYGNTKFTFKELQTSSLGGELDEFLKKQNIKFERGVIGERKRDEVDDLKDYLDNHPKIEYFAQNEWGQVIGWEGRPRYYEGYDDEDGGYEQGSWSSDYDRYTQVPEIGLSMAYKSAKGSKFPSSGGSDNIWSRSEVLDMINKHQNRTDNSKENDMKILDELKKLISKVENEKGEQDMDEKEKVDNENVDKRKLIDEVAGIMKSAGCDDEDIRTAIGKMEKIGYDKSEAGSADNKKVKNEEPDKKDDVDDKKVDNEDEEDKEKVKEVKEEVKEDVDNKCKNSKSSFDKINEIYNSVKQIEKETGYVSRQQKLDNAVEYFK